MRVRIRGLTNPGVRTQMVRIRVEPYINCKITNFIQETTMFYFKHDLINLRKNNYLCRVGSQPQQMFAGGFLTLLLVTLVGGSFGQWVGIRGVDFGDPESYCDGYLNSSLFHRCSVQHSYYKHVHTSDYPLCSSHVLFLVSCFTH